MADGNKPEVPQPLAPREHMSRARFEIVSVFDSVKKVGLEIGACTHGANGVGGFECQPEVFLHIGHSPLRVTLDDITPAQAREVAAALLKAADFAEGGAQ